MPLALLLWTLVASLRFQPGPADAETYVVRTITDIYMLADQNTFVVTLGNSSQWDVYPRDASLAANWMAEDQAMLSLGSTDELGFSYHIVNLRTQTSVRVRSSTLFASSIDPDTVNLAFPPEIRPPPTKIFGIYYTDTKEIYIQLDNGAMYKVDLEPPYPFKRISSRWKRNDAVSLSRVKRKVYFTKITNLFRGESVLAQVLDPTVPQSFNHD